MTTLSEQIQAARRNLNDAEIAARHSAEDLEYYRLSRMAAVDYAALGKNEEARKSAFYALLAGDETYVKVESTARVNRDLADRFKTELECLLDERREQEQEVWRKLADYLVGRMDYVSYVPVQAVRAATREEVEAGIFDTLPTPEDNLPF